MTAYLITFRTYGTWLHGDERGSMDRRFHNAPGSEKIPPRAGLAAFERDLLKQPAVTLTDAERTVVKAAIERRASQREWSIAAINVRTEPVHIVVHADALPERLMNEFKAEATRSLREHGSRPPTGRVWSRHGSTRHLGSDSAVANAVRYVLEAQDGPRA